MKYIKTLVCSLTTVLSMLETSNAATTNEVVKTSNITSNSWTFAVDGVGSTSVNGNNETTAGGQFELGKHVNVTIPLTKDEVPTVVGIRQSIVYADVSRTFYTVKQNCNQSFTTSETTKSSTDLNYSTAIFADFDIFTYKRFELDGGANLAAQYGNQPDTFTVSPEAVGRIFFRKDVDLFGRAEYPFNLSSGKSEDAINYYVGIRIGF